MHNKSASLRYVLLLFLCISVIVCISVFYLIQAGHMVENSTLNTVGELAGHDSASVQNFVEMNWDELSGIQKRFEYHEFDTVSQLQEQIAIEKEAGTFDHLYLVAEDGTVYTDGQAAYPKEQTDVMQYFEEGKDRIVKRFDGGNAAEPREETLLYGLRLKNDTVEGIRFIALAGTADTSWMQEEIMTSSFVREGKNRGYGSIIDLNGDFILNAGKDASLYDLLEQGSVSGKWNKETVSAEMAKNETFHFYFTDENHTEKLLYFMPVETAGWYYLFSVEKSVFTEQSRPFSFLNLAMLAAVIATVVCLFMFFKTSYDKKIETDAETKSKNEFLSHMSHEIRTPLNGVIGLLHLMRTHLRDNNLDQMEEWIDKTHATSNYLLSLVSNFLDMTKLDEGKFELISEPFSLNDMIDEVWTMQHNSIESKKISFIVDKNITVPCIIGDKLRIKQVLMNILGNASKFTPEEGEIKLSVSQEQTDDSHVTTVISCKDSGVGMSPQFLNKIWESFSQEHNNKSGNSTRGSGLGMALSKRFIDAMGGELSVTSQLNEGSTFTITLHSEIAEITEDISAAEIKSTEVRADGRPIRLLIAEDNELNAEILTEILKDMGFLTVLAENGQAAVDQFAASEPWEFDYILMDMQMPVMDGCEAAKIIRGMDRPDAREIPIFACTANTFREDKERASQSGMNDFLIKPIDVNVLLTKLSHHKPGKT